MIGLAAAVWGERHLLAPALHRAGVSLTDTTDVAVVAGAARELLGVGLPSYERARLADIQDLLATILATLVRVNSEAGANVPDPEPAPRPWKAVVERMFPQPVEAQRGPVRAATGADVIALFGSSPMNQT